MKKYYLELSNGKRVSGPFASLELACGEFAAHLVTSAMPVRLISERVVREEIAIFRPSAFNEK